MLDTRDRIITCSRPLFAKNGFHRLTMDQISREMHISKRTIYEQFHHKDELVEAVCASFVAYDQEQLKKHMSAAKDCPSKMRALFRLYDLEGFASCVFKRSELDELKEHFPGAWAMFPKMIAARKQLVADVYHEGIEQGVFLPAYPAIPDSEAQALPSEKTIDLIVFFASALIDEALLVDLTGSDIDLNTALQYACDMVLRSISVSY